MGKIAFIFPGQGAQYAGMGRDLYENIPVCREMIDLASQASGVSMPELLFEENDRLNVTEYTQIAMLAVSVAALKALEEKGIHADVSAGLSLGEYGALVAAGVLTAEDAFALVRKRGIFMQEAVPEGGAMAAVIGSDAETIERICRETEGQVSVANYNCPGQIVITGEESAVAAAGEALKAAGAKRVLPLKVSGPFHSPMLKKASEQLKEALTDVELHEMKIPYLTNVTGDYVKDISEVKELLETQVCASVRWQQSVEKMIADGVDTFVEIGPGRTLTGFLRKIDRSVKGYNVDKLEDLEKVAAELAERQ